MDLDDDDDIIMPIDEEDESPQSTSDSKKLNWLLRIFIQLMY